MYRKVPTWISKLGMPPASGEAGDLTCNLNFVVHRRLLTTCKAAQPFLEKLLDNRPHTLMYRQPGTATRDMCPSHLEDNGLAIIGGCISL